MYDQQNFEYDVEIYHHCKELSFSLSDFQIGFFNDKCVQPEKPELDTEHTKKIQDHDNQNISQNQEIQEKNPEIVEEKEKNPRIVESRNAQLFRLKKYKNGRPKEIKNINQILKTETLFYLNMLADFQILTQQEKSWVKNFKQESLSWASFSKLMQKQLIKIKLREFYTSTELVRRVLETHRLTFPRKMEVIKNINISLKFTEIDSQHLNQ